MQCAVNWNLKHLRFSVCTSSMRVTLSEKWDDRIWSPEYDTRERNKRRDDFSFIPRVFYHTAGVAATVNFFEFKFQSHTACSVLSHEYQSYSWRGEPVSIRLSHPILSYPNNNLSELCYFSLRYLWHYQHYHEWPLIIWARVNYWRGVIGPPGPTPCYGPGKIR